MTILQLQYALSVQKFGNFKLAAHNHNKSQPGLSLQIAKLEDEIGVIIFDRSSNPIKPTQEGKLFLMRAREIVLGAEQLQGFASSLSEEVHGKLSLGIIPTLAPFLVPLFIDAFQEKFPELSVEINEMTTEDTLEGVKNGDLDGGIISTPIAIAGIKSRPVFYEKFFFYYSENRFAEVSLSNIDYDQLWLLNEGNCFRDQINNFCDVEHIRKSKSFVYRSNSIDALIRIVENKGGVTILPELTTLLLSESQEENLIPIRDEEGNKAREIGIIMRNRSNKEHILLELETVIKQSIPHSMLQAAGLEVLDPEIG